MRNLLSLTRSREELTTEEYETTDGRGVGRTVDAITLSFFPLTAILLDRVMFVEKSLLLSE